MIARFLLFSMVLCCFSATADAQLIVPDITNSQLMLFDETDGSLIDASFINMTAQAGFPVNAVKVGREIWVSNQTNLTIHRFNFSGQYLGDVSGDLDYVRGMEVVGNKVYAVNAGQNTGHPERTGVAVIDVETATVESYFRTGSDANGFGFDVVAVDFKSRPALLIPDQSSTDEGLDDGEDIDLFDLDGNFLATFHDSDGVTGIDNPMQLVFGSDNSVLVAGFTGPLFGIFRYDPTGVATDFYLVPDTNVFGVFELQNGNILFTTFDGVFILDPSNPDIGNNVETVVSGIVAGFIEPFALPRLSLQQ